MRILALETTDKTGSVAAIDDDNLLAELMLDHTQRSAQSLAPAMQRLLKQVGWLPADVQLVAVSVGPGSFTGLRVGVTTAKVFAYAVGAEVLGIDTLEAIAGNCVRGTPSSEDCRSSSTPNAARSWCNPSFGSADGWFAARRPARALDADAWLARLQVSGSRQSAARGRGERERGE